MEDALSDRPFWEKSSKDHPQIISPNSHLTFHSREAFDKDPELSNLLLDEFFRDAIHKCQGAWRDVISKAVECGIPTPAFSTALAFYDGYRAQRSPANLIQVIGKFSELSRSFVLLF